MKGIKLSSILFTVSSLFSCQSKSQLNFPTADKSLLWEVTGKDLTKPVFIYGTMHLLCESDAVLSDNLKKVIAAADEIYFEIDMDDIGQLLSGFTLGKMKDDTTISQLLSEDEYQRIEHFFSQNGLGVQLKMFNHMQPMLVSSLVYQAILPCDQTDGIEMNIMKVAKQNTKEIKGLETTAFQVSLIDQIPYHQQAQELLYSIDSISSTKLENDEMTRIYKEQDIDKLLDYSLKTDAGTTEEVQDVMINQRNKNWAEQFPNITKNKTLLIAVGAGHLGGKQGLVNLLKEKGYNLRAVQN
jgi:uncharacterized protein